MKIHMKKCFRLMIVTTIISSMIVLLVLLVLKFNNQNKLSIDSNDHVIEDTVKEDIVIKDDLIKDTVIEDNRDVVINNEDLSDINLDDDEISMIFAGDVYISSYIEEKYNKSGLDGVLSKDLQKEFHQADVAMINQEFPFSQRGVPAPDKQFTFRINPKYISIFKEMNINIVTLANNHVLDYGHDALMDTIDVLDEANIKHVGAGANIVQAKELTEFKIGNKTVGILGASRVIPVTSWNATSTMPGLLTTYDPTILIEEIKQAKQKNDIVFVYVHWGIERNNSPEQYQRQLAKAYIDAGADLVVGSHPHVLQGIEFYKNKPIVYSLGNFIFYNTIDKTMLLKTNITKDNEIQIFLIPCNTSNACTNNITQLNKLNEFYSYIEKISFDISIDSFGRVVEKNKN